MNADEGAGAFAIQIKIADVKFAARALQLCFVSRVHCAGQAELGVVGYAQRVIIVVRLDHGENWPKDFFLFDCRASFHVRDDSWLDEESLFAIRAAAGNDPSALGFSFFNIAIDRFECFLVDDGAHRRSGVGRIADLNFRS